MNEIQHEKVHLVGDIEATQGGARVGCRGAGAAAVGRDGELRRGLCDERAHQPHPRLRRLPAAPRALAPAGDGPGGAQPSLRVLPAGQRQHGAARLRLPMRCPPRLPGQLQQPHHLCHIRCSLLFSVLQASQCLPAVLASPLKRRLRPHFQ